MIFILHFQEWHEHNRLSHLIRCCWCELATFVISVKKKVCLVYNESTRLYLWSV